MNHSIFFRDLSTGVHIHTAEGTNNALKIQIKPRNRTKDVDGHISEIFRRRLHSNDLWHGFFDALKEIHYDLK